MYGNRCGLPRNHDTDHVALDGKLTWPRDLLTWTDVVSFGARIDGAADATSPLMDCWWIYREDGDPIHDEYTFSSGGSGAEPDWSDVETDAEAWLSNLDADDADWGARTYVAGRIRQADRPIGGLILDRRTMVVTPKAPS